MTGILYIVATPIGNMEDITLRAIKTLKNVDLILAEDTRRTGLLLAHLEIKKPLLSYYEQNELQRISEVIERLITGQNIALVSNAGTPTLSDPGFKLVRECIKEKIPVVSIPGPSAILTALTSSGLPTDKFLFLGYLPKKQGKRKKLLNDLVSMYRYVNTTTILFEAPHRLIETLNDLKEVFGDIEIIIARELTKLHEEIRREKISQSLKHFQQTPPRKVALPPRGFTPRGEFTIVFNLNSKSRS